MKVVVLPSLSRLAVKLLLRVSRLTSPPYREHSQVTRHTLRICQEQSKNRRVALMDTCRGTLDETLRTLQVPHRIGVCVILDSVQHKF